MKLDNIDILLIRACKVQNAEQRLNSVYRRFYLNRPDMDQETRDMYLANILLPMVQKLVPVDITRMMNEIEPSRRMYDIHAGDPNDSHWTTVKKWCISQIRYRMNRDNLDPIGFISPSRFKNKVAA